MKLWCARPHCCVRARLQSHLAWQHIQRRTRYWSHRKLAGCRASVVTRINCARTGVWRAHVDKFSPEWFVAVHATIPFIAMLRKACLMPKWAITFTVASAIIGQVLHSVRFLGLQP